MINQTQCIKKHDHTLGDCVFGGGFKMTDQPLPLKSCPWCGNTKPIYTNQEFAVFCKNCQIGRTKEEWQNCYCWKILAEKDSEIASLRQGKQVAQEAVLAQLEKVKELEAEIAGLKAAHRGSQKDSW